MKEAKNTNGQHTSAPWYISEPSMGFSTLCQSGTHEVIFGLAAPQQAHGDRIGEEETQGNADFIIRAVNSHYDLLKVAEIAYTFASGGAVTGADLAATIREVIRKAGGKA